MTTVSCLYDYACIVCEKHRYPGALSSGLHVALTLASNPSLMTRTTLLPPLLLLLLALLAPTKHVMSIKGSPSISMRSARAPTVTSPSSPSLSNSCAQFTVADASISALGIPASERSRNSSHWNLHVHANLLSSCAWVSSVPLFVKLRHSLLLLSWHACQHD